MVIKDTPTGYGLISRWLHWGMALAIFVVFGIGVWMVGLDYQSPYYRLGPDIHRSAGILLLIVLGFRLLWRAFNTKPVGTELTAFERAGSRLVHWSFYVLLAVIMVSGYFISSADGQPVAVFDWFSIPAVTKQQGLADSAGFVHRWLAYGTMALALAHSVAALKHHFSNKDQIMRRMWNGPPTTKKQAS